MIFYPVKGSLKGELGIPGDKSISHRTVILGSISEGTTQASNFLTGADCLSTISAFRTMGIQIQLNSTTHDITIHGAGMHGLVPSVKALYCGNSGTTVRLMSGLLSGQQFETVLTGDDSILKRPMKRVIDPLTRMGAEITSEEGNDCAPLLIRPVEKLHGISYNTPVASAQVKSSILLAGLYAEGQTKVTEPAKSRNHTELMLRGFGADLETEGLTTTIRPGRALQGQTITIPGDISSAAYFIAAALLVPGSEVLLKNVGTNPTRDGILRVAEAMGAKIERLNETVSGGEPSADLLVRSASLHGTTIEGSIIPTLIDELPVIVIMAAAAEGRTIIRDAAELKVKESDRIKVMTENLKKMGADITATDDGFIINGGKPLHGAFIDPALDHRVAMSFAVAALIAEGPTEIDSADCVKISYPTFFRDLNSLRPAIVKDE